MFTVSDRLITPDQLKDCLSWLNMANWTYGWPSSKKVEFGHWNVDITNAAITNSTDVSDRLPAPFVPVWASINGKLFNDKAILVRSYSNRHTFGTEGYIHTDTPRPSDYTCIVYMDPEWNADWGGETLFYNKDKTSIISAVIPKFGRVVSFSGVIPHKASALSRVCSRVRTTLMFKVSIEPRAIYPSEKLLSDFLSTIGAAQKPHKKGSLKDHLMRTFHLLKSAGASDDLCIIGGLHSVYGTNKFKNACLSLESDSVELAFGKKVDKLVRLFASINRPAVLETPDGTLSDRDLFLLRCVECANLYDQQELTPKSYPNLHNFTVQLRQNRKES